MSTWRAPAHEDLALKAVGDVAPPYGDNVGPPGAHATPRNCWFELAGNGWGAAVAAQEDLVRPGSAAAPRGVSHRDAVGGIPAADRGESPAVGARGGLGNDRGLSPGPEPR